MVRQTNTGCLKRGLLQIVPTSLLVNNIKQRLRTEPTRLRRAHSPICIGRLISPNSNRLLAARPRRSLRHQLTLATLLHRQEPKHRLLHAATHSQQTMVLQQRRLLATKTSRNVLPLLLRQHNAIETLIQHVIVVERARILRQRVQLAAQAAERAAVDAVAVRGAQNVWSSFVDGRVDHVGGGVEQAVRAAVDHVAGVVDEDQVGLRDEAEGAAEGVHPEAVGLHGVAERDVACDAFVEAVFAEDAEGCCQAAFEVVAFGVFVGEGWWSLGSVSKVFL